MPAPCILTKFSTNLPRAVDLPLKCCKKNMNRRGVLESSNKIMSISENSTKNEADRTLQNRARITYKIFFENKR